jgi:hypothetical protein
MYCSVSIANDAMRQQSKKEWGSGCLTAGGNPDSNFWSWCSCQVEMLMMSENLWLL